MFYFNIHFYDSKSHIIYKITIIIRCLVRIFTSSHPLKVIFRSPITMASYHCHCCWLYFFVVLFFPSCQWVQSLVWIADYNWLLFWEIIFSIYIFFFSPRTMLVFYCHLCTLLYFVIYIFFLSTDECYLFWYFWLHWKHFAERLYYSYIAIYHYYPYQLDCVVSQF